MASREPTVGDGEHGDPAGLRMMTAEEAARGEGGSREGGCAGDAPTDEDRAEQERMEGRAALFDRFRRYDRDSSGSIDSEELVHLLRSLAIISPATHDEEVGMAHSQHTTPLPGCASHSSGGLLLPVGMTS